MKPAILIIGAGQSASQTVDALRRKGFAGSLTLVGEEPELPYQRPPLSKKYLSGALARDRMPLRHQSFYDDHGVDLRLGRRATSIDRATRRVQLDDGSTLAYDTLVLATGSRPRQVTVPGSDLAGIHSLRTMSDADRLRDEARPGS